MGLKLLNQCDPDMVIIVINIIIPEDMVSALMAPKDNS